MLNSVAFATSIAILSGVLYMLFYVFAVLWHGAFRFIFNAQFYGADVASLLPPQLTYVAFLGTFVTVIIAAWLVGYAWGVALQLAGATKRLGRPSKR